MSQSNRAKALKDLTPCIQDIMSWNVFNMLKCNPNKTEKIHALFLAFFTGQTS